MLRARMPDARPWARPLTQVLELEPAGADRFTTRLDGFGAVTLGCATLAAALGSNRPLHALHAWFLRPPPQDRSVELVVERVREGRRLAQRRVAVKSGEQLLCEVLASFATPAAGLDAQDERLDPAPPPPEALPSEAEIARSEGWKPDEPGPLGGPLEWRWVEGTPWRLAAPADRSRYGAWVRPRFPLPPARAWHAAALAFLTDYHSHMSVARWLGAFTAPVGYTSLDQALWLHRDVAWDDWLHLTTEGVVAHAGRALTRRSLHTRDGRLVATMAQEQLIPGP
jgi:acyl-CoA thioesterase-2